jgi:hypothetical protein
MCYEAAIVSAGGDKTTFAKSLIISLEDVAANWYSRLPPRVHLLLATTQRKVPTQFLGVRSGARYGRRFSILRSARKRNTPQFLPKVFTAESLVSRGIKRPSHHLGHQSFAGGALAQPPRQKAVENSAGAL